MKTRFTTATLWFTPILAQAQGTTLTSGISSALGIVMLIGFLFGLAYGGGIIVRDTKRHALGRRQVFLMTVFLSMVAPRDRATLTARM